VLRELRESSDAPAQAVTRARDGEEACTYLFGKDASEDRPLPSIVLLDLHLPRVDGMEVLRRIRADQRTRLVPVIMLTSSDDDADVTRSYRLGVNSFVRKPVDHAAFRSIVRSLGEFWLDRNVPPPEPAP
jgi:two-component system response regulator